MAQRRQAGMFGEEPREAQEQDLWTAFDRFWDKWPRRDAKADAMKAWKQLKPSPALVETILEALEWQIPANQWTQDRREFIPLPATFIRGRRWEDERRVQKRSEHWSARCPHRPTCTRYDWCELLTAKEKIASGEL